MNPRISAVIPCAGLSRRMGCLKPLLKLGGRPLIVHVIETVKQADPVEIRVVIGHQADRIEPEVINAGAKTVRNPDYLLGMFSSVRAGLKGLEKTCDAFLLLPADIPLVRPTTIHHIIEINRTKPDCILYPTFEGRRGHPPLIPSDLIRDILNYSGDGGLRAFLSRFEHRAMSVPVMDKNILFDLDCPGDYEDAIQHFPGFEPQMNTDGIYTTDEHRQD